MELIGAEGASHKTQELLLDNVMNGFVYSLFELKWARYASRFHHALLFFDGCYVVLLGLLCFALKQARLAWRRMARACARILMLPIRAARSCCCCRTRRWSRHRARSNSDRLPSRRPLCFRR
eukprot:2615083-Prymnesium_polylepis.2